MDIEKTYELPFPRAVVFDTWVSSDTVIVPADEMIVEGVSGGRYELIMHGPDGGARNAGRFHSVAKNERVVYTWEWNGDGEVTVIDVTFQDAGENTKISLSHRGFKTEHSRAMHESGWDSYITGLIGFIRARSE